MSRLHSDALDECCQEMKGHTNWTYMNLLTKKQQKEMMKHGTAVVFWNEGIEDEEENNEEK